MSINAPRPVGQADQSHHKQEQYQYERVAELQREVFQPDDDVLAEMSIADFRRSEKYPEYCRRFKHHIEYLQSKIMHRIVQCNDTEQAVMTQMLADFARKSLDDDRKHYRLYSDADLALIYTDVQQNMEEFVAVLDATADNLALDDIARAMILFLPEKNYGCEWVLFCTEAALQELQDAQHRASYLAEHLAEQKSKSATFTAIQHNKFEVAHGLLNQKQTQVSVTEVDESQRNMLHLASVKGHLGLIDQLLSRKTTVFDPRKQDIYGNTALHLAVMSGSTEAVARLIRAMGASTLNANHEGKTALHLAVEVRNTQMVKLLLAVATKSQVNHADKDGNTAAHIAAQNHQLETLKLLIANRADIKQKNHLNQSVLDLTLTIVGNKPSSAMG
ncbi:MAG: ankyrin repeat domain-containing protein [Parashewanella sp.]